MGWILKLPLFRSQERLRQKLFPGRLGYKKDKIQELADSFVSSLSASSRLAEAAAVATEYLHDADSAVSLLAQVTKSAFVPLQVIMAQSRPWIGHLRVKVCNKIHLVSGGSLVLAFALVPTAVGKSSYNLGFMRLLVQLSTNDVRLVL